MRIGVPLALLLLAGAVGLAACGGGGWQATGAPAPSEQPGRETPIEHPRRAEEIVVSVWDGADGLTLGYTPWRAVGRPARFLLYGNGAVLLPASAQAGRIPSLTTYRLTEEGIQTVLRRAEDAGLLSGTLDYGEPEILDVGSIFVTLRAGGREITHSAYALGLDDSVKPERRRALTGFIDYLAALLAARPDLLAVTPRPYKPASVDVFAWEQDEDDGWTVSGPTLEWPLRQPLAKLPVSDLDSDAGCASIRRAEVAAVARALRALPAGEDSFPVWRSGKRNWLVAFEVNLPGEPPCPRQDG